MCFKQSQSSGAKGKAFQQWKLLFLVCRLLKIADASPASGTGVTGGGAGCAAPSGGGGNGGGGGGGGRAKSIEEGARNTKVAERGGGDGEGVGGVGGHGVRDGRDGRDGRRDGRSSSSDDVAEDDAADDVAEDDVADDVAAMDGDRGFLVCAELLAAMEGKLLFGRRFR